MSTGPSVRPAARKAVRKTVVDPLDVLEQLRVVVRLASAHSAGLERTTGLPGAQLWALHEVAAADGLRVGELAERLRVHQTTVSNLLNRLEAGGLVRKGRLPEDGRVVRVFLTAAGRRLLRRRRPSARGLLPSVLDAMPPAALQKVHAGLALLLDRLGGDGGGGSLPEVPPATESPPRRRPRSAG